MTNSLEAGHRENPILFEEKTVELSKKYLSPVGMVSPGIKVSVGNGSYHLSTDNDGFMPNEEWIEAMIDEETDQLKDLIKNHDTLRKQDELEISYGGDITSSSIEYRMRIGAFATTIITAETQELPQMPEEISGVLRFLNSIVMRPIIPQI